MGAYGLQLQVGLSGPPYKQTTQIPEEKHSHLLAKADGEEPMPSPGKVKTSWGVCIQGCTSCLAVRKGGTQELCREADAQLDSPAPLLPLSSLCSLLGSSQGRRVRVLRTTLDDSERGGSSGTGLWDEELSLPWHRTSGHRLASRRATVLPGLLQDLRCLLLALPRHSAAVSARSALSLTGFMGWTAKQGIGQCKGKSSQSPRRREVA